MKTKELSLLIFQYSIFKPDELVSQSKLAFSVFSLFSEVLQILLQGIQQYVPLYAN
jgi:hypothetical protein